MRLFFAMPLVALLCGCQDETTLYLWIENKTDDTLVVEVSRRNMAYWPVREFTIPPGWNHSLGTWDERGICDDCSQFMEPWLWMDSLVLNSHEWVNPKFPQGEWDFHLHEGSTYRQFNHTLEVTARDIE
jgi:hypothetical protein